jgi:hypothetical protein
MYGLNHSKGKKFLELGNLNLNLDRLNSRPRAAGGLNELNRIEYCGRSGNHNIATGGRRDGGLIRPREAKIQSHPNGPLRCGPT